jgi:hypothetical protein
MGGPNQASHFCHPLSKGSSVPRLLSKTPWLGLWFNPKTRPVQTKRPTAKQVAETVVQEMKDPGYMVSFYQGDKIDHNQALHILARRVLQDEKLVETLRRENRELEHELALYLDVLFEIGRQKRGIVKITNYDSEGRVIA